MAWGCGPSATGAATVGDPLEELLVPGREGGSIVDVYKGSARTNVGQGKSDGSPCDSPVPVEYLKWSSAVTSLPIY